MIPRAQFGRTGHSSTRLIFGAAALGGMSPATAESTLQLVDRLGIDHIDTAASYGAAEDLLRPFLADHRDRFFLATKTGERTGAAARAELERSLVRMGVDHVDLIQLHNLVEPDEWDVAVGPGGAVEALFRARDEGLCSFVGVTGHGLRIPSMHLRTLERHDLDSVLFPYNHSLMRLDGYRAAVEELRAVCADRRIAVQTIKSVARGRWAERTGREFSWYEPLGEPAAIDRAVRYVLANDDLFLNTSSDARLLTLLATAASGDIVAPSISEMDHDIDLHGITPLFEPGDLERI